MCRNAFLTLSLILLTCGSCTKDIGPTGKEEGEVFVKYIKVSLAEKCGSRASIASDGKLTWKEADNIYYITGRTGRTSGVGRYSVQASGLAAVTFPVTYADGDTEAMFFTLGESIQKKADKTPSYGNPSFSTLTIEGGVPSSQDGAFENLHIGVAAGTLNGGDVTVSPVQSFVKFSLGSLSFGGKTVNKIVVTTGDMKTVGTSTVPDPKPLCGDMTITNPGSGNTVSFSNTGTSVTIDKSSSVFSTDTEYYVALMSGATWSKGLKFTLYNIDVETGAESELGDIHANGSISLTKGEVLNLGRLDIHSRIFTSDPQVTIVPEYAAIAQYMDKKVWLHIEPADFDGKIEWSLESGGTDSPAVSLDNTLADEILSDGLKYKTVKLVTDPVSVKAKATDNKDYADPVYVVARITNANKTTVVKKCTVYVGNFIYTGCKSSTNKKTLWAKSNMTGDYNTGHDDVAGEGSVNKGLKLSPNPTDRGSSYPWGYLNSGNGRTWNSTLCTRWGGTWDGTAAAGYKDMYGGKYNQYITPVKNELDTGDDVCYKCNSTWRMPNDADFILLFSDTYHQYVPDGDFYQYDKFGVDYKSRQLGYTDVWVRLQFGTCWLTDKYVYGNGEYWTREITDWANGNSVFSQTTNHNFVGRARKDFCLAVRAVKYVD